MTVLQEIANERRRQIEVEGWTPEHDDKHSNGEMADAAALYARDHGTAFRHRPPKSWPWDASWWKPKSRRQDLIRAAALIVAEVERLDRAASDSKTPAADCTPAQSYQSRVGRWMIACFGADITNSLEERCYRFFEEAGELCQSLGMTIEKAHQLVDYTWGRAKGEPRQESGGVSVTHAALCHAAQIDMDGCAEAELSRVNTPEMIEKIRAKHAAKVLRIPDSPLPGNSDTAIPLTPEQRAD